MSRWNIHNDYWVAGVQRRLEGNERTFTMVNTRTVLTTITSHFSNI
jgi:hypothetical protein